MSASSVTGVGLGSAEFNNPGSKSYTVAGSRLIGPRVVAANTATLASGSATVKLPLLSGLVTDYVIMVSDASGTAAATSATMAFGTNVTTLTLKGTGTNVVNWAILKVGQSLAN